MHVILAHDPGKYRGITLLSHIMQFLERIMDNRLRERVEHELGARTRASEKDKGPLMGCYH